MIKIKIEGTNIQVLTDMNCNVEKYEVVTEEALNRMDEEIEVINLEGFSTTGMLKSMETICF